MNINLLILSVLFVSLCGAAHHNINLERMKSKGLQFESADNGLLRPVPLSKRASDLPLTTNGYAFVAPVTIGTPAKPFKLHVDTGSTFTAVPSQGCTRGSCDTGTPDPLYQFSSSTSASPITCGSVCDSSRICEDDFSESSSSVCDFTVTYGVGEIAGLAYTDVLTIGGVSATVNIGAITISSSNFEAPEADGIMGLAYNNPSYTTIVCCTTATPVLDSLVSSNGITDMFALKFTDTDGILTIGGYDESLVTGTINYSKVVQEAYYMILLSSIGYGNTTLLESSAGTQVILDSGTSFLIFPTTIYNSFKEYLQNTEPYASIDGVQPDPTYQTDIFTGTCYGNTEYISSFPTFTFTFSGATVVLPPDAYIILTYDSQNAPIYCLAISAQTSDSEPFILGTPIFRDNYIIFDRVNNQIGFGTSTTAPVIASSAPALHTPLLYVTIICIVLSTLLQLLM